MKVVSTLLGILTLAGTLAAAEPDKKLYELRVYWANEGKLEALHSRFRDHTLKLFAKHGMTNVGYWVPVDNGDNRLVYMLAHKDRAAADASWKAFVGDPDWKKAYAESIKEGRLVKTLERFYINPADFSPPIAAKDSKTERIFELRTYVATPKNLEALLSRFRDHTVKLFEKHGITNVGYWTLAEEKPTNGKLLAAASPMGSHKSEAESDASAKGTALVYLLSHASDEARKKSFDTFRADPAWIAAKSASESKAGGPLTVKDGVKSLTLKPTDYSPTK